MTLSTYSDKAFLHIVVNEVDTVSLLTVHQTFLGDV